MTIVSGDVLLEMMERTKATELKCLRCGAIFTFGEAGRLAIDAGESGRVKCPSCGVVHEADVHPKGIELDLDGYGQWFDTPETPAKKDWRFWRR